MDVAVKWEPLLLPREAQFSSDRVVAARALQLGDLEDRRGQREGGGVFYWDDVRAYNRLTERDYWLVVWPTPPGPLKRAAGPGVDEQEDDALEEVPGP